MNKKLIIIGGYLAAGKSTFALRLSKSLSIPYLIKDTLKEALCASVPIGTREESSKFSVIVFDAIMYVIERLMETGFPFIIEGNFVPAGIKNTDEAEVIKSLIEKYNYQSLYFNFTGSTQILHQRFTEREKLPERGKSNIMFTEIVFDDFDKFCRNLDRFNIGGEILEIDTTDFKKVDFEGHIETTRKFLMI